MASPAPLTEIGSFGVRRRKRPLSSDASKIDRVRRRLVGEQRGHQHRARAERVHAFDRGQRLGQTVAWCGR